MAELTFEHIAPSSELCNSLEITTQKASAYKRLIQGDLGTVSYTQFAVGQLTVSDFSPQEASVLDLCLPTNCNPPQYDPDNQPLHYSYNQAQLLRTKMQDGTLTTPAYLYRAEDIHMGNRKNKLTRLQLGAPILTSLAGNLALLRNTLLADSQYAHNKWQLLSNHHSQQTTTADTLHLQIANFVIPKLLSIHALTPAGLMQTAAKQLGYKYTSPANSSQKG